MYVFIYNIICICVCVCVHICVLLWTRRRAFIITINSFGTELTRDDREKLYPRCGYLFPEGLPMLAKCDDYDQVVEVAGNYNVYKAIFEATGQDDDKTLEDRFFEHEVRGVSCESDDNEREKTS